MRESINIEEVGNYSMVFLPRVMMLPPLLPLKEMLPRNLESFSPPLCMILVNIKGNQMLLVLLVDTFPFTEKILKIEDDAIFEKNLKDILPS